MDYQDRKARWLSSPLVSDKEKDEIKSASVPRQKERFGETLSFKENGIRAKRGIGPGRINRLTIARATYIVSSYLLTCYGDLTKKQGRIVAMDTREGSSLFQEEAIKVLTGLGIKVYTFHDPHPTPQVSYAIRKLMLAGGIRITGGNNPKGYNGFRFFDKDGVEALGDCLDKIARLFSLLPDELSLPIGKEKADVIFLDETPSFDEEFLAKERETSLYKDFFVGKKKTKIVFSPHGGCTCSLGPKLLQRAGYEVKTTAGEDYFNPPLSNVSCLNPNSEEAFEQSLLERARLNGKGNRYNLILVCDEEGEKAGIAFINQKGKAERLKENQYRALLTDFLLGTLKRRKLLPINGVRVDTLTTSSQGKWIASSYNVKTRTVENERKYMGALIRKIHREEQTFLFGYGESSGVLLSSFVRDGDALETRLSLSDRCEYYLRKGLTLDLAYKELCEKTGTYFEDKAVFVFDGIKGREERINKLDLLRNHPFTQISGYPIRKRDDYKRRKVFLPKAGGFIDREGNDISSLDCLKFFFSPGGFLVLKPRENSPQREIYLELVDLSQKDGEKKRKEILSELKDKMGLE